MLLSAQYLVDRLRHPRSRADEVLALRRRLDGAKGPTEAGAEARALALSLRQQREALSAALTGIASCSGCSRGHPLPHGRWPGGHCCGTRTEQVFTDDEVAALRAAGTTPADLSPPEGDHAGCAFRGPRGCSLAVADRPTLCVRFVCRELEDELRERGDLREIKGLASALGRTFERFRKLREAEQEAFTPPLPDGRVD